MSLVIKTTQSCLVVFNGYDSIEDEISIKEEFEEKYPDLTISTDPNYFYNFTVSHESDLPPFDAMTNHEKIMIAVNHLIRIAEEHGLFRDN